MILTYLFLWHMPNFSLGPASSQEPSECGSAVQALAQLCASPCRRSPVRSPHRLLRHLPVLLRLPRRLSRTRFGWRFLVLSHLPLRPATCPPPRLHCLSQKRLHCQSQKRLHRQSQKRTIAKARNTCATSIASTVSDACVRATAQCHTSPMFPT